MTKKVIENRDQKLTALGKRLKDIRKELKIMQKDMAKIMSKSTGHISDIEKGRTAPGFDFFDKLFNLYPVNPLYLFKGEMPILLNQKEESPNSLPMKEDPDEFGESTKTIKEMLHLMTKSRLLKYEILGYFERCLFENREVIEWQLSEKGNEKSSEP